MSRTSLFLTHRVPFPPNRGDKIRSFALLRYLANRGPVKVGCFIDDPSDRRYLDQVRSLAGDDCYFEELRPLTKRWRSLTALWSRGSITSACFGSPRLQRWVNETIQGGPIDDVVVFGSAMAPYLMNAPIDPKRVLFDMVDVDSDKWRQYAKESGGLARWLYKREAQILEGLERGAAAHFGQTLLSSQFEAKTFSEIAPESADFIGSFPNGVDSKFFAQHDCINPFGEGRNSIVMTGRMDYRPNHAGASWFVEHVMPLILSAISDAHVYFVGAGPPHSLRKLAGQHVTVTGSVPDIRPYIQHAGIVIAPLLMARGVQNKVLEAMSMGKPVVATWQATRALDVAQRDDIWIENEPSRFAKAVVEALTKSDRSSIARTSRQFVRDNHDWDTILSTLDTKLDDLHSKAPRLGPGNTYSGELV